MKQTPVFITPQTSYIPLAEFFRVSRSPMYSLVEKKDEQLSRMYSEYSVSLLKFCMYKLSSKEKAQDVVAETFARTWNYLVQDKCIENEQSFLYTTARHLIIDEYRKKKSFSLDILIHSGLEIQSDSGKDIYDKFDWALLTEEMQTLPKTYSLIMTMRYVHDYSISDISKHTNSSENAVSVKIHRGVLHLRKLLMAKNICL